MSLCEVHWVTAGLCTMLYQPVRVSHCICHMIYVYNTYICIFSHSPQALDHVLSAVKWLFSYIHQWPFYSAVLSADLKNFSLAPMAGAKLSVRRNFWSTLYAWYWCSGLQHHLLDPPQWWPLCRCRPAMSVSKCHLLAHTSASKWIFKDAKTHILMVPKP